MRAIMKAEIKAKWVEALRSGEYRQGRGYLRNGGGFCCLGVLCDLAAKEGIGEWVGYPPHFRCGDFSSDRLPPQAVLDWAGLTQMNPLISDSRLTASSLNDNSRFSFNKIAELIERNIDSA